jgi:hypothetical protein
MKKLLFTLLIALACALPASATTITVAAYNLSNLPFNPTNIGNARTFTVTTTNGSATVTSSAAFSTSLVGIAGFQVAFSGSDSTQYVISGIASTSSLTLSTVFAGTTGSKTMTLYPYVLLRTYATQGFQDNVTGQNIQAGTPGSGNFYKQVAVSIINTGSGNVAWMPEFTISSTTDGLITSQSRYVFGFYRSDGSLLSYYLCGSVQQLAIPPVTPTTWTAICNYNAPSGAIPTNNEVYTKNQIDQRFPSCTAGMMIYYLTTGNIQTCLTVGSGLSISAGTITASGAAGSLPTATFTSLDYSALTTDWLISVTTASASRTVTLFAAAGNTGKILTVCKLTTDVNTVAVSDGSSTLATIYAPETCVQLTSTGSVWRIQSF